MTNMTNHHTLQHQIICLVFIILSFSICSAKNTRKSFRLGNYQVSLKLSDNSRIKEFPYEEGKFVDIIDDTGSIIILFSGGLTTLPIIKRDNAEIISTNNTNRYETEFGKKDSLFYRETTYHKSNIRVGYDRVSKSRLHKYEKILKSVRIKQL
jgi:hypothetical protein